MSPDSEPQRRRAGGRARGRFRALRARRSPPAGGCSSSALVLGALIGFLFSLSDGKDYKATAQVYLGQPLGAGLRRRRHHVTDDARPRPGVRHERGRDRARPPRRRAYGRRSCADHVTARPIPGTSTTRQAFPAPLLSIQVTGASNARRRRRRERPRAQVVAKCRATVHEHEDRHARASSSPTSTRSSGSCNARLDGRTGVAEGDRRRPSLSPTEKLVALTNLNAEITLAEQRQDDARAQPLQHDGRGDRSRQGRRASRITSPAIAVTTSADEPADRASSSARSSASCSASWPRCSGIPSPGRTRAARNALVHARRQDASRSSSPRTTRRSCSRRRSPASPRSSTASTSSTTPRATRPPSGRGRDRLARRADPSTSEPRRRRGDRHRLQAGDRGPRRRHLRDGRGQPDGARRSARRSRAPVVARRGRLREGEPARSRARRGS